MTLGLWLILGIFITPFWYLIGGLVLSNLNVVGSEFFKNHYGNLHPIAAGLLWLVWPLFLAHVAYYLIMEMREEKMRIRE